MTPDLFLQFGTAPDAPATTPGQLTSVQVVQLLAPGNWAPGKASWLIPDPNVILDPVEFTRIFLPVALVAIVNAAPYPTLAQATIKLQDEYRVVWTNSFPIPLSNSGNLRAAGNATVSTDFVNPIRAGGRRPLSLWVEYSLDQPVVTSQFIVCGQVLDPANNFVTNAVGSAIYDQAA